MTNDSGFLSRFREASSNPFHPLHRGSGLITRAQSRKRERSLFSSILGWLQLQHDEPSEEEQSAVQIYQRGFLQFFKGYYTGEEALSGHAEKYIFIHFEKIRAGFIPKDKTIIAKPNAPILTREENWLMNTYVGNMYVPTVYVKYAEECVNPDDFRVLAVLVESMELFVLDREFEKRWRQVGLRQLRSREFFAGRE